MTRALRTLRLVAAMGRDGFAAARGLMWTTTALTLVNGVASALYPYGFLVLTDALVAREATGVWIGVGLTGGLVAVSWTAAMFDANVGFELVDRVNLLVSTRMAEMVNRIGVVGHLERPDVVAELDLVEQNREVVGSAPRTLLTAVQALVRGVVLVVLLWTVRPALALLPLVALAPAIAESRATRIRDRADTEVAEARRLRDQLFEAMLSGPPAAEIRIYRLADDLIDRHARASAAVIRVATWAAIRAAAVSAAGWAVFLGAVVAGVLVTVDAAVAGEVSAGQLILAVVLAQQAHQVLVIVTESMRALLTSARTVERISEVQGRVEDRLRGTVRPPDALSGGVTFEGVGLRYPGAATEALADVDLHLPAGATVAVVGENGAGKSTLVKVLTGMYTPTAGRVLVDGVDLATLDTGLWRERIAATFQDFVRFELRAGEIVGIGDLPRVDDEVAVRGAIDRAGVTAFAARLPGGLAAPVGRSFVDGIELSTGQWQQLAIARGMMRQDPLVLILDEPAASLDPEAEHRLVERYAAAARAAAASGGLSLLVTHRFTTVADADLVVVMGGGRVVEVGSHDELIGAGGTYAEMVALQSRGYV